MFTIRFRLSLAFVMVALLAGAVTAGAILWAMRAHFSGYRAGQSDRRVAEVQEFLAAYWTGKGSWEGVSTVLLPAHGGMMQGMPHMMAHGTDPTMSGMMALMELGATRVRLVGVDGRTVVDTAASVGAAVPPAEQAQGFPISAGGQTVGTLLIDRPAVPPLTELDIAFTRGVTASAMAGGVGVALAAGVLGFWTARKITRPLSQLSGAAKQLAGRDMGARVAVPGRDEVAALAEQFNRMAEQLERQETLRRTMVADVAHELRTPVAILRGQFEALQDGAVEPTPDVLLPLHDEVVRLGRLLDDLQALSLADAGQLPLRRSLVDPGDLARAVGAVFGAAAQDKGVQFASRIATELPVVNIDADRIKQVLLNLLGNALRHTQPEQSITLEAAVDGAWLVFSVRDTGEGISAEELPHVFDRFYRSEKSRSRAGGGSGLGLAIARGIAEAHGGTLTADSVLGKGSTFYLRLPVQETPSA